MKNKIVVCDELITGMEAFIDGAAGMIMQDVTPHDAAYSFPLPASYLHVHDATQLVSYTRNLSRYSNTQILVIDSLYNKRINMG